MIQCGIWKLLDLVLGLVSHCSTNVIVSKSLIICAHIKWKATRLTCLSFHVVSGCGGDAKTISQNDIN